ncbi:MAG: beta-lactamase family protein [Verrucomicrobiota bacterium]|nr:beta-lactamase family protein [Verrucomicrobiota bacterium]
MPGLAAAYVVDGALVESAAVGFRKHGSREKVAPGDRWHIGSCTKSMTATLAAMLVEEGKLRWETTVAEAFPEVRDVKKTKWSAVTLEQLLAHRGGAPETPPPALWAAAARQQGTVKQQRLAFVRGLFEKPPESEPGTRYAYSNGGYTIAGAMIERAAGRTWEELMRERLFLPLAMSASGFGPPGSAGRVDQPWGHEGKGKQLTPQRPGPGADNPPAIGPAGTVHCSIEDFARYAGWHAQEGRGGGKLLTAETFARIHQAPAGQSYAFGWETLKRGWAGGRTHAGSNTLWLAVMWVAPEKNGAFVAATNMAGDEASQACNDAVSLLVERWQAKTKAQ